MGDLRSDEKYWNSFYQKQNENIKAHTKFAEYIFNNWTNSRKSLLEFGCGNGRDSLYFQKSGLDVTGIDVSTVAIEKLKKMNSGCTFICDDFIISGNIYQNKYDICYSRFTVHAITLEQENSLINNAYNTLNTNGLFCIEVRSIHDELYGKGMKIGKDEFIFDDHYRRFIRMNDFLMRLMKSGFTIRYAEENRGFAPFGDVDPMVIRVIAEKES